MIFPLLEIIGKKQILIIMKNEKKKIFDWCRILEISYCMRLYCGEQWQRQGAGLGVLGAGLGVQAAGVAAGTRRAAGAGVGRRGRRRRAGCWAQARLAGVRTGGDVRGRALTCAGVRGRARERAGRACAGRQAGGRASAARGARGRQGARGHGRLGGLGYPWAVHSGHSAHFRSVLTRFFFPESPNEHRSL